MASEKISSEIILKGAVRKETAWKIISDFERFPILSANIDTVKIHEKDDKEGVSEWSITVDNAPLEWLEKDYYDKENYKLRFESIECDFEEINGRWIIEDYNNEGISVFFELEYELGIPVIEIHLGPILKKKMGGYVDSVLMAIKEELKKHATEERKYKRFPIGTHHNLSINGNIIRASIINVSQGGIMITYDDKLDLLNATVKINGTPIDSEIILNDLKQKNYRIVFKENVSEEEIGKLVQLLSHETHQVQEAVVLAPEEYTKPSDQMEKESDLIEAGK